MLGRLKTVAAIFGILWIGVIVGAGVAFVGMSIGGAGGAQLPSEQLSNGQADDELTSETPTNDSAVIKQSEKLETNVDDIHRVEVNAFLQPNRKEYKVIAELIVPPEQGSGSNWYVTVGDTRKQLTRDSRRVVFRNLKSLDANVTILRTTGYGNVEVIRSVSIQDILQKPIIYQSGEADGVSPTQPITETENKENETTSSSGQETPAVAHRKD